MRSVRSIAVLAVLAGAVPAFADPMPTVLELYTSQGCASCPAADKLLAEYVARPGVVALSFSVDYWDYLGWRDTLARPAHSARQKAYADMRADRKVFTPQMIVNGRVAARGHDRVGIERAIAETRVEPGVAVSGRTLGDMLEVAVPAAPGGERVGEVWALAVSRQVDVEIGRGENAGRTIRYHHVVRSMTKVGDWFGKATVMRRPVRELSAAEADMIVLLVQGGHAERPGPVLGVTTVALR